MSPMFEFKQFQKELNELIMAGEKLLDTDENFLHFIIKSVNQTEVLNFIKDFKEDGNDCFKNQQFEEALDKYVYAGIISARYDFKDAKLQLQCFNLATCVLLNAAACFGKLGEFDLVGRVCTFVLEYNPKNIKAMYRRAMAAMELGQPDLAFWELQIANELDPSNLEVQRKLQHIGKLISASSLKGQQVNEMPNGLGKGLPSPMKKIKQSAIKEGDGDKVTEQEDKNEMKGIEINQECREILKVVVENKNEVKREAKTELRIEGELHDVFNLKDSDVKMSEVETVKEQVMEAKDVDFAVTENRDQAKPKYRFINQRRPGSFLFLSRKDYANLEKGGYIHYANNNITVMTIKMVQKSNQQSDKKAVHCKQEGGEAFDKFKIREMEEDIRDIPLSHTNEDEESAMIWPAICQDQLPKRKRLRKLGLGVSISKMKKVAPQVSRKWKQLLLGSDARFGVGKIQLSQQFIRRKGKPRCLIQKKVDHQQDRKEIKLAKSKGPFRFSAKRPRKIRDVKYHAYRAIVNKRNLKKQLHCGKRISGQKRKRILQYDMDHINSPQKKPFSTESHGSFVKICNDDIIGVNVSNESMCNVYVKCESSIRGSSRDNISL